jgi:hypothetical protein
VVGSGVRDGDFVLLEVWVPLGCGAVVADYA